MELKIEIYREDHRQEWEQFVFNKAINATFLHSRAFYDHNASNATDDRSIVFLKGNKIIALFPANLLQREGKNVLHSYLRATYGGIIISDEVSIAELEEMVSLLVQFARNENIHEIIIRQSFGIYHSRLCEEIGYLLWKNNFAIKSREFELAIDVENDFRANYNDSTSRSIKKAFKQGVVVTISEDIDAYWGILEANLKERYNTKPVHDIQEIRHLISKVGAEKVKLFAAYLNDKMIGGILAFIANKKVVHAQYIANDYAHQEYRPLNAIIDYMSQWSRENGYKYVNLGMASEPGGTEINAGLCRFKEGFGARGVLRETMHLTL
jgi:hypothetical protein